MFPFFPNPLTPACLNLARSADGSGVPEADVEAEEEGEEEGPQARAQHEGDVIDETIFTFESFELVSFEQKRPCGTHPVHTHASRSIYLPNAHPSQKFANSDITQSLLTYLGRYREFRSPDEMKRVVSLLHRQAVRAKAEGLFFQVKSLLCFDPLFLST